MFLSKCELNIARRGTRHLLASPQRMHAAVEASFPALTQGSGEASGRRLWRVDDGNPNPILYVVSDSAPDFTHIEEQAGWPTQPSWAVADYSPLLSGLSEGQLWEFRLAANPVHSVRQDDGKRSKRFAHVTVAQQEAWLAQRADKLGVAFDVGISSAEDSHLDGGPAPTSFRIDERRLMKFRRKNTTVTVRKVRFDGLLRVTDPQALREALLNGIGPAKAYGCGLLTLVPAVSAVESQLRTEAASS